MRLVITRDVLLPLVLILIFDYSVREKSKVSINSRKS